MMMQRVGFLVVAATVVACGAREKARTDDSAGGEVDSAAFAIPPDSAAKRFDGDRMGRIPVLEYHVIAAEPGGMFTIGRDQFRGQMAMLYERGYRPITVRQLVARDFSDVPVGMSPVVFTFDDASPEQFSFVERGGRLEIDPNSAVGIWMDFAREHPDWSGRATFCLLPAAEQGHAFFGDKEKFGGQKAEWRFRKVKWLADNGFELCNHTLWHAQLNKYPDAFVQEQIARGLVAIDSAVPGYDVQTFALPQGLWPRNEALAWRGSWTDPATGRTVRYQHRTVLEVAGGPVRSPFDPEFDERKLTRIIVYKDELENVLDGLESSGSRFVWDGMRVARATF